MDKRILVTGATGFIGRNTLIPLMERGFEVIALTSRTPENTVPGVRYMQCDLADRAAVKSGDGRDQTGPYATSGMASCCVRSVDRAGKHGLATNFA